MLVVVKCVCVCVVYEMCHDGILPSDHKQDAADAEARQQNVHPDIRRQGVEEGEDPRVGAVGLVVEDADAQSHEGLGEVDHLLPHVGDGERGYGEVGHLTTTEENGSEPSGPAEPSAALVLTWSMSSRTMPFHSPLSFWAPYFPSDTSFTSYEKPKMLESSFSRSRQ